MKGILSCLIYYAVCKTNGISMNYEVVCRMSSDSSSIDYKVMCRTSQIIIRSIDYKAVCRMSFISIDL